MEVVVVEGSTDGWRCVCVCVVVRQNVDGGEGTAKGKSNI